MDEAAPVRLAERRGDADREEQEAPRLHRRSDEPLERFAARILDQELSPAALLPKLQWSRGPSGVKLVSQCVFVGKAMKHGERMMTSGRKRYQKARIVVVASNPPSTAEDTLAVVRQELEIAESVDVKLKPRMQFLDSTAIGKRRQ